MLKMDDATGGIPVHIRTTAMKLAFEIAGHLESKGVSILRKPFGSRGLVRAVNVALLIENQHPFTIPSLAKDGKPPKPSSAEK